MTVQMPAQANGECEQGKSGAPHVQACQKPPAGEAMRGERHHRDQGAAVADKTHHNHVVREAPSIGGVIVALPIRDKKRGVGYAQQSQPKLAVRVWETRARPWLTLAAGETAVAITQ